MQVDRHDTNLVTWHGNSGIIQTCRLELRGASAYTMHLELLAALQDVVIYKDILPKELNLNNNYMHTASTYAWLIPTLYLRFLKRPPTMAAK